jgi:quercetin dioxygenase-like cupin family protein
MTQLSQEIVELAKEVHIIDDVINHFGIDTLEGRVGPLLFGNEIRTHYIDMPSHSYVDEHPHDVESLTYTVRGRWVMCANGNRHLMGPGSLYWFGPNIPTGYEVPFDEPAYLLVFRSRGDSTPEEMIEFARDILKPKFVQMQAEGESFMLKDLPANHPALAFAHEVNPARY